MLLRCASEWVSDQGLLSDRPIRTRAVDDAEGVWLEVSAGCGVIVSVPGPVEAVRRKIAPPGRRLTRLTGLDPLAGEAALRG